MILVPLELEFAVGESKQDRFFFVPVPLEHPIAGSTNLAVIRGKELELAENLVKIDECVREDIFPKVGWEFGPGSVPKQYGLGVRQVPSIVVLKFMRAPQVVGELDGDWSPKWDEVEVDCVFSRVMGFPFVLATHFLGCCDLSLSDIHLDGLSSSGFLPNSFVKNFEVGTAQMKPL